MTPLKAIRGGCLCCPGSEDILSMSEVLYQGFGGYHVEKDGEIFYWPKSDLKWEEYKTLADIEKDAKKSPKSLWQVILNNPLRGATWERKRGQWHLIESNAGFA
jgi:hypothetical protein